MSLRTVTMKYDRLVDFIHQDSAGVWRFRYGLALSIGTLKIMAGTALREILRGEGTHKTHRTPTENICKFDKMKKSAKRGRTG
jgi:hypothetical protein